MRKAWISAALGAAFAASIAGPSSAQQATAQPAAANQDQTDQTASPAPKPKHARKPPEISQINPDLDTDDQLAPSQMKQPMPAAVAEPSGAPGKLAHPAVHAAADAAAVHAPADAAAAHPAVAAGPAGLANSHVVTCSGIFGKDSSHLKLAMTFEAKNITFTDVDADGGAKIQATVLFPKDPKRRLEVWWSNPAARSETHLIVIGGQSTWIAPNGMRLGLTLAQLEKLNHKPFKLKGFDKSGAATVNGWDGGALTDLPGGCISGVSFRADPKAVADAVNAFTADKEYSSADPAIRAVKPTVSEILIGY
jgi:hypothetical protein